MLVTLNFYCTGGLQFFTAPPGVTVVTILCLGAQGGPSLGSPSGKGASMQGDFTVTAGEELSILVGAVGDTPTSEHYSGGGGGGSFVWRGTAEATLGNLLIAAGGGGGGSYQAYGVDAVLTTGGTAGNGGGAGGSGGDGGRGGITEGYEGAGGAGAGILTNGEKGQDGNHSFGANGGQAIKSGGNGGTGVSAGGNGGFGGGGGGAYLGGGGGGGYSGGGGGGTTDGANSGGGGGGGSYNGGTNPINAAGVGTGSGLVTITYTAAPARGLPLSLLVG